MAAENNDDNDDFDLYHVDFTTASEWEVFIARIEEILQQWKLNNTVNLCPREKLLNATWFTDSENVNFADFEFVLTRHYVKNSSDDLSNHEEEKKCEIPAGLVDMMNHENDFVPVSDDPEGDPHSLVRWYGLRDFVVLTPLRSSLASESQLKVLLSSFAIALNNIGCQVPMFVRYHEPQQKFYAGICESPDVRAEFDMVHLRKIPSQCRHLTGLLNLFKSKIGENEFVEPVTVAARFAYTLNDWTNFAWTQDPPDIELLGETGWSELGSLPFGSICEPISNLTLFTTWPEVLETMAVDTDSYSDFDPLSAPVWSVSITRAENLVCLLTDYFTEFLFFCTSNKTTEELLGDFASRDANDMLQPFSLLTESRIPTISNLLSQYASRKKSIEGPINHKMLMPILYYLFPDVEENSKYPYSDEKELDKGSVQRMKTCGKDSLIWRLSLVMAHALHMFGGPKAAAHIWHEFSQEIRFRWNSGNMIPGIAPGFPDPKSCLLHQKLQLINCCIERKTKREESYANKNKESAEDDSEDEFFDCDDNVNEERDESKQPQTTTPIGRLHQHGSLRLINTGEPLFVPLTQGATPKTEDQLEEDAQVLIQLGADAEASQLRAKIMSASLLSDMQSFKAANPGAVIEDFIRWYSPRDWIEEEELDQYGQKKGKLSARMTLPGNTWLEVWDAAKPVPAMRQKRLFDETTEAEKALHYIESQSPGNCAVLVLPVLAHAAVEKLGEEGKDIEIQSLKSTILQATRRVEALTRNPPPDLRRYQELCMEIGMAESVISQIKSLQSKLGGEEGVEELVWNLVGGGETTLPDAGLGPVATKLRALFHEALKVGQFGGESSSEGGGGEPSPAPAMPTPSVREFVLRGRAPRPHRHSRPTPHRLHIVLTKEDIAMAGAYTQDKTFF